MAGSTARKRPQKHRLPRRHKPGSRWRVLAHADSYGNTEVSLDSARDASVFDEVVVDAWLHAEQMHARVWLLIVGETRIAVTVGEHGEAREVRMQERGPEFVDDGSPRSPDALRRALVRLCWNLVADCAECSCSPGDECPSCETWRALYGERWPGWQVAEGRLPTRSRR